MAGEAGMKFEPETVARALRKSWSTDTAQQWSKQRPAAGQCNVTALLVHDLFGGELLKAGLPGGDHFYNRIDGVRYDFSAGQFDAAIGYADTIAARTDAERGATSAELLALRSAFMRYFGHSG
jgi:hypothetical protein